MLISLMEVSGKPSVSRSILIFFSAKIFRVSLSLALHTPQPGQVTPMGGGLEGQELTAGGADAGSV